MRHKHPHWLHSGLYYGRDRSYVGEYYNNEDGWWVGWPDGAAQKVSSRAEAVRIVEAADHSDAAAQPPREVGR